VAKILTGPLAASISGKLGPVVFRYDRFGQIVYSKAKTHVHKTAPAMLTKSQFRDASHAYSKLIGLYRDHLNLVARATNSSASGEFIRAYLQTLRTGSCQPRINTGTHLETTFGPTQENIFGWLLRWTPLQDVAPFPHAFAIELTGTTRRATNVGGVWDGGWFYFLLHAEMTPPIMILQFRTDPEILPPNPTVPVKFAGYLGHIYEHP
jgi:hypothetical protein